MNELKNVRVQHFCQQAKTFPPLINSHSKLRDVTSVSGIVTLYTGQLQQSVNSVLEVEVVERFDSMQNVTRTKIGQAREFGLWSHLS